VGFLRLSSTGPGGGGVTTVVEDGLREYIPAVRQLVLDTIAAGRELLANTISLILIQAR